MVTIETVTVDPSGGGDYTSISSAEADLGTIATTAFGTTDLTSVAGGAIIEIELVADTYDLSAQQNWAGVTSDSTSYVALKAASGAGNEGEFKRSGSAIIEWTGTASNMFYLSVTHMHFEDLTFDWTGNNGQIVAHRDGTTFSRCMMKRSNNATGSAFVNVAGTADPANDPLVFEDSTFEIDTPNFVRAFRWDNVNYKFTTCTLWNRQGTTNMAFLRARDGNTYTGTWTNNVINNRGKGTALIQSQSGSTYLTGGSGNVERSASNSLASSLCLNTSYWTFTTDTGAGASSNQIIWNEDSLKLYDLANNDAWQALTSLTGVNATDIAGDTRSASGYNPGAYEADAAATGGVTGTGSGAVGGLTISAGTGTVTALITGSGSGAVGGLTISAGTGASSSTGSGSGSVGGLTISAGTGASSSTGTGSGAVGGLTVSAGTGASSSTGTGSGSVGGLTVSAGTGASSLTGSGSGAVGGLTITTGTGTTTAIITGSGSGAVGGLTITTGTGASSSTGTGAGAVGGLTITTGTGASSLTGSGAGSVGGLTITTGTGSVGVVRTGSGLLTLGGLAITSGTGASTLQGSGSGVLSGIIGEGQGLTSLSGSGTGTLSGLSVTGTGRSYTVVATTPLLITVQTEDLVTAFDTSVMQVTVP